MMTPILLMSIWLAIMVFFLVVEATTFNLITVWFALGSLVAALSALFGVGLIGQIILFLVGSVASLLALRPFCKKFVRSNVDTSISRLIGQEAIVILDINPTEGSGQVKIQGQIWSAKYNGIDLIPIDNKVKVVAIEGVKLLVEKI